MAIRALSDQSFAMQPGEVLNLLGDHGAGTSTKVKLNARNFPPIGALALVNHLESGV